jgi:hypothetical protein
MLEGLLEGLFSFLAEVALNVVAEGLAEAGLHALAAPFERRPHPLAAVVGYVLFGAVAGALSSLLVSELLIEDQTLAMVNLAVSPVLAGLSMMGVRALRARRGQPLIRLDSFFYGWLFAAAFVLTRFAMVAA